MALGVLLGRHDVADEAGCPASLPVRDAGFHGYEMRHEGRALGIAKQWLFIVSVLDLWRCLCDLVLRPDHWHLYYICYVMTTIYA